MSNIRYDKAEITTTKRNDEGYLTVTADIARPGVFPYLRGDGSLLFEAKLPEDILHDSVIQSAITKPVTDEHPPEPVNSSNWSTYAKGFSHTDSRIEDDKIAITLTVTDSALIKQIEDKSKQQLSIGFETDVVDTPGSYQGQRYDVKQTNIKINHIAVVKAGRAGPQIRLRTDSAIQQDDERGLPTMAVYKIDGKEFEVASEVKSLLELQAVKLDAAEAKAKTVDTLQGKFDAIESELAETKEALEEAKKNELTDEQIEEAAEKRAELVESAKVLVGDSADFKGKSVQEIKIAAIKAVKGDSFDATNRSAEYIDAFFDASVGAKMNEKHSSTGDKNLAGNLSSSKNDAATQIELNRASRLAMKGDKK